MKRCHWAKVLALSPVSSEDVPCTQGLQNIPRLCHGEGLVWEVSNGTQNSSFESPGLCPSHLIRGLGWNHCFTDVSGKTPAIARLGQDSPARVCDTWENIHNHTGGSPLWSATHSSLSYQCDTTFCWMCERLNYTMLHQRGQNLVKHIHTNALRLLLWRWHSLELVRAETWTKTSTTCKRNHTKNSLINKHWTGIRILLST